MTESRHFQKDGDSCPEGACGSTMHITLTIEVINQNVLKVGYTSDSSNKLKLDFELITKPL